MPNAGRLPGRALLECLNCPSPSEALCARATPDTLHLLARYKSPNREVKAGEDIFVPGDPSRMICSLLSGWAFRYTLLEDGRRQILDFPLAGAVLRFHPSRGSSTTFGAQALTDCVVCAIPYAALIEASRQQPAIGLHLATLISQDFSLAVDHLTSVGRQSARERVAHLLLRLFVRYRVQWPDFRLEEMHLPLTHEHIADATGLTFIHVCRVLRSLRTDGIVEFRYHRLRILDPDKLADVAEVDPQLLLRRAAPGPFSRPDGIGGGLTARANSRGTIGGQDHQSAWA